MPALIGHRGKFVQPGVVLAIISLTLGMLACTSAIPTPVILVKTFTPTMSMVASKAPPAQLSTTSTPSPLANATIIVKTCFLRSGPGKTYRSNGAAKAGDIFPVFAKDPTGEWYQLNWREQTWIAATLVKLDVDPALIPTVNPETGLAENRPLETRPLFGLASTGTNPPADTSNPTPTETKTPASTPTIPLTPTPTGTSTAVVINNKIEAMNFSMYRSSTGSLLVFGEVRNHSDTPIKNAKVTVSIFDAGNNLLDAESGYVYTPWGHGLWSQGLIYEGDAAPFEVIFDNPGSWVNYAAKLDYEVSSPSDSKNHYNNLAVKNDIGRPIDDFLYNYQVSGEVVNTGGASCGNVWMVATLFNKSDQIVGIEEGSTDFSQLNPGQSTPFKIKISTHGDVAYYRLLLDAIGQ